jgi:hypothetical protein
MRIMTASKQLAKTLFFALILSSVSLWTADMKPEDLVAKHLDSIGTAQARKDVKSRVVQGGATYRVIVGGSGAIDGKYVFASDGPRSNFLLKINASSYHGEQFICDGNKTSIAATWSDKTHSEFGDFVLAQDIFLKDNLLGGVWSAGWPLLDIEGRGPKLHSTGIKKIDGKELLGLRYQPRKSTDLEIVMYFDPQTYRHVMTTYYVEPPRGIEGGELAQAMQMQKRYRAEERFSEFQTVDGLTLPSHYDLRFTLEAASGQTKTIEWEVRALSINNNISIDPRSFQVK